MTSRTVQNSIVLLAVVMSSGAILAQEDLSGLISSFQSQRDMASKEAILGRITAAHPDSGPALLKIARKTKDVDTEWLAIRGLGDLKYMGAAPFLKQSLSSSAPYVRANAARALGEMRDSSAIPDLIGAIKKEDDDGVIEQSAMALEMLGARDALPLLEAKTEIKSVQTRIWILGAIEVLGSKAEVPFLARFLRDGDESVAQAATHAIERLTGEDFGFPKCDIDLCVGDPNLAVAVAQKWWSDQKQEWKQ